MGVLKLGTVGLDGTKIHANASRHSALSYEHAGRIEAQLKGEVAELLAKAEAAKTERIAWVLLDPSSSKGEQGTTFIVRQWRHSWDSDAWELPAGTREEGEEPLATARRELVEEVGLEAGRWDPLGTARATAVSTMRFHLFLARDLSHVERRPEIYEQDMVIRELLLAEALELAVDGTIQHAASIAALFRAQRFLT